MSSDVREIKCRVLSHDGEACKDCGRPMTKFVLVDDALPEMAAGDIGVYCFDCEAK